MNLLRTFYYFLSPGQRRFARRLFYGPIDFWTAISGKRQPLVPPRGKIFTGQGNFVAMGDEYLRLLINSCRLQAHHHLLDVGCGMGRLARPLTGFLNEQGRYAGFDIVEDGVRWCQQRYAAFPNFSFQYIPLRNDLYNLSSSHQAEGLRFPYDDSSFDVVVLLSVFTHMQPGEVENYLAEINRVLKPGGQLFATFFIITDRSEAHLDNSPNPFFPYRHDNYFLHHPKVRNANIAFRASFLQEMFYRSGLSITQQYDGWWAGDGAEKCPDFQDIIVCCGDGEREGFEAH